MPFLGIFAMAAIGYVGSSTNAQTSAVQQSPVIRIGEKLSYTISFGRFTGAGHAETQVVSRGKISGRDALEIRSKVKTVDMVSAAFFMFDESRTVYAAPDTLLPLYVVTNSNDSAIPKETIKNFLTQPSVGFDLITLLYKAREAGGNGTFPMFEGDNTYTVTFASTVSERVRTDAGDFETMVSTVQSEMLAANGIKELKINLSTDEFRMPVLFRFKTAKGEFRALLSGIFVPEPETPAPTATPTPVRTPTPRPVTTPTPDSYVENQALAPELGFQIGESLDYRITSGQRNLGVLTLSARERKKLSNVDTLVLTAEITAVEPGVTDIRLGDKLTARVDPETLVPFAADAELGAPYPGLPARVTFDRLTGAVKFGPGPAADSPIGTHSIVSLMYAMRSFNLRPSKNRSNPVNDTRVAVFWDTKAHVFTLRPSEPEEITISGNKLPAQLISITTHNPQLDRLQLKVWLSADQRVPLRFAAGAYTAELIIRNATLFR